MPVPATEFHDRGNQHGLKIGQRAGRNRRREGIGNIVGPDIPRIEEGKDGANGKDVVKLVEIHFDTESSCPDDEAKARVTVSLISAGMRTLPSLYIP